MSSLLIQPSSVDGFMEDRAPLLDEAWKAAATDVFQKRKRERQASQKARDETKTFKKFLRKFIDHVGPSKRHVFQGFDVDGTFEWKDVQQAVNEGLERDSTHGNWRHRPFQFLSRSFQRGSTALQLMLDFIPDTPYTSLICGVLRLVFRAAKRVDDIRDRVITCLENLSVAIQGTEKFMIIYADYPDVWDAAEELYLGILEGVEAMLHWIDSSAFAAALKSLFGQQSYGKSLEEKVIKQGIDDRITKFESTVNYALHIRLYRMDTKISDMCTKVSAVRNVVELIAYQQAVSATVLTSSSPRPAFLDRHQLRALVGVQPGLAKSDRAAAALDGETACSSMARSLPLLDDPTFRQWFASPYSQILVVNGGMLDLPPEQEAASPLTMMVCMLSGMLDAHAQSGSGGAPVALTYICGQHNRPGDEYGGPGGMLRCLAAQMLDRIDLSAFDWEFARGIERGDLPWLMNLFKLGVWGMGRGGGRVAVVVIVDGISWLESPLSADGFRSVVGEWVAFIEELNKSSPNSGNGGVILKILLTNPGRSGLGQTLPQGCVVDLMDEFCGNWSDMDGSGFF